MVRFVVDIAGWKPALAVVAAHGMTDLNTREWIPLYLGWLLLPLPPSMVTGIFCASSIVHFANDGGPWVTLLAHAGSALVGMLKGKDAAFKAMLTYLCLWHTPRHYARHWKQGRARGLALSAVATVAALALCHRLPNRLPLTDTMQRVVIAHISHELSLRV